MAGSTTGYAAALRSPPRVIETSMERADVRADAATSRSPLPAAARQQTSAVSANTISPDKAVLIENVPNTVIDDYLKAVSAIIPASDITHCSRIVGGNICIFLRQIEHVDRLVQEGDITIKGTLTSLRRFKSSSTRIVFSNVFPFIPSSSILTAMSKYGRVLGVMREIPSGSKIPGCAHIKSFRRTAQFIIDDINKVPSRLQVQFEGNIYTIYLSMDDVVCYHCKAPGHVKANCPNVASENNNVTNINIVSDFPALQTATSVNIPVREADATQQTPFRMEQDDNISPPTVLKLLPEHTKRRRSISDEEPPEHKTKNSEMIDTSLASNIGREDPAPEMQRLNVTTDETVVCQTTSFSNAPSDSITVLASGDQLHSATRFCEAAPTFSSTESHRNPLQPSTIECREDCDDKNSECASVISDISMDDMSHCAEQADEDPLSAEEFKSFVKATRKCKKVLPIAKKYTKDYAALRQMIDKNLVKVKDKNVRSKLQKLSLALEKETGCKIDQRRIHDKTQPEL